MRTRNDHKASQQRLEQWLHSANNILSTTNPCTVEALKEYSEQLKVQYLHDFFYINTN